MPDADVPPLPRPSGPRTAVYDAAYAGVPNWDIGRPQRAFVHLAEAGLIRGRVLDLGCGTGELTLYLAGRGHNVLGVDLSTLAIAQARTKARWRRVGRAHFLALDALRVGELARRGFRFDTVVDCAMFHVLGPAERDRLVDELAAVVEPGGRVFVLGDRRRDPREVYGLSEGELRGRFAERDGWRVEFCLETVFERRSSRNPALLAGMRRVG